MPSKKRKYNARFPAGRIKKIMQTDEEVGKVAQAVPIIISRTLELFVESLLSKAMQVTLSRNAKTLSPSHVKQCILAESRFDFLKDLVKNIPDVSAAEEKEMMSAESSPNSSRYSDMTVPPRRIAREDSNSSSSSDLRLQQVSREGLKRGLSSETERRETVTSGALGEVAIDLTKRPEERPVRTANFYQETLVTDELQHRSVITLNPTYATPQPSTSTSAHNFPALEPLKKVVIPVPKPEHKFQVSRSSPPRTPGTPMSPAPVTPVNPILNIDFSKNLGKPEIKVLDTAVAGRVELQKVSKNSKLQRQNSKAKEVKRPEPKPALATPVDIDHLNSGNLQIDEDYDT